MATQAFCTPVRASAFPHDVSFNSPRSAKHEPLLNCQLLAHAFNVRDEVPGSVLLQLGGPECQPSSDMGKLLGQVNEDNGRGRDMG
jgi:hypothetical protein